MSNRPNVILITGDQLRGDSLGCYGHPVVETPYLDQLAHEGVADELVRRGILYAPDYLVNAGGVIQVEDERHGFSFARAEARTAGIFDVALRVFRAADDAGVSPAVAAPHSIVG